MTYFDKIDNTINNKEITFYQVALNRTNHIVDFKYTPGDDRRFTTCVNVPTNRPGYVVVAALNGGAFKRDTGEPIHSCQIAGSNKVLAEYSVEEHYNDGTLGVAIVNDEFVVVDEIRGEKETSLPDGVYPDLVRGSYRFSMKRVNGTLQPTYGAWCREDAVSKYNSDDTKVGIGFKNANSFFIYGPYLTGEELRLALQAEGFTHYVNLDGGSSSHLFTIDGGHKHELLYHRPIYETFYLMEQTQNAKISGYGLVVNKLGLNIRSEPTSSSTKLTTVSVGGELKIKYFLEGFQDDGYQWAAVWYNGIEGFSQIDTLGYYTVELTNTSAIATGTAANVVPKQLYLVASSSGAWIRPQVASGDHVTVPAGARMLVTQLLPGFQSDGYQWVKVSYNGVEGFVQADVNNWHYFTTFVE